MGETPPPPPPGFPVPHWNPSKLYWLIGALLFTPFSLQNMLEFITRNYHQFLWFDRLANATTDLRDHPSDFIIIILVITCVLFQQGFFVFVFHTCRKTEIREKFYEVRQYLFSTHGRTSSVVPPPAIELNDGEEGNRNRQRGSAQKSVDASPSSRVRKVMPLNERKAGFSPPKG